MRQPIKPFHLPPTSHHPSNFLHSLKLMMASEGGPVFDVGPASGLGPTPEARPAAEGGSVFYAGPASGLGPTPEARPAAEGEPASTGGPEAEFHVTDRVSLLKTLKDTLQGDVPSTIWASLWLSDIDKLKELVDRVKQDVTPWASYLKSIESETRIVQRCNSIDFHVFLQYRSANII